MAGQARDDAPAGPRGARRCSPASPRRRSNGSRARPTSTPTTWPTGRWTSARASRPRPARPARSAAAAAASRRRRSWTPPEGTPTRLILVRHGSTEHSPAAALLRPQRPAALGAGRAPGRGAGPPGAVASDRSPRSSARRCRGPGRPPTAIAAALGLPGRRGGRADRDRLRRVGGLTGDEVRARWPAEHAAWLASPDAAPPGGESFAAVARRVRRARDEIIAAHPGRDRRRRLARDADQDVADACPRRAADCRCSGCTSTPRRSRGRLLPERRVLGAAGQRHQPPRRLTRDPTQATSHSAPVAAARITGTVSSAVPVELARRRTCSSAGSSRRHSSVASEPT